jgi:hypothetical protein
VIREIAMICIQFRSTDRRISPAGYPKQLRERSDRAMRTSPVALLALAFLDATGASTILWTSFRRIVERSSGILARHPSQEDRGY